MPPPHCELPLLLLLLLLLHFVVGSQDRVFCFRGGGTQKR